MNIIMTCQLNKVPIFNFAVILKENEILRNVQYSTIRGKNDSTLIVDDYGYVFRKNYDCKRNNDSYWNCSKKTAKKCRCSLMIRGNLIRLQKNQHNHDPE